MRRIFSAVFWFLAATIVLFEEWLWEPVRRVMARFAQWPLVRSLSAVIAALPAHWAALVFLVPVLALIPFKLGGLWLIGHGQLALGLAVFIGAKLLGTALFAWLFTLTKPALLTLGWFAALYHWALDVRATVHHWIRRQRPYRAARIAIRRLRHFLRALRVTQAA